MNLPHKTSFWTEEIKSPEHNMSYTETQIHPADSDVNILILTVIF